MVGTRRKDRRNVSTKVVGSPSKKVSAGVATNEATGPFTPRRSARLSQTSQSQQDTVPSSLSPIEDKELLTNESSNELFCSANSTSQCNDDDDDDDGDTISQASNHLDSEGFFIEKKIVVASKNSPSRKQRRKSPINKNKHIDAEGFFIEESVVYGVHTSDTAGFFFDTKGGNDDEDDDDDSKSSRSCENDAIEEESGSDAEKEVVEVDKLALGYNDMVASEDDEVSELIQRHGSKDPKLMKAVEMTVGESDQALALARKLFPDTSLAAKRPTLDNRAVNKALMERELVQDNDSDDDSPMEVSSKKIVAAVTTNKDGESDATGDANKLWHDSDDDDEQDSGVAAVDRRRRFVETTSTSVSVTPKWARLPEDRDGGVKKKRRTIFTGGSESSSSGGNSSDNDDDDGSSAWWRRAGRNALATTSEDDQSATRVRSALPAGKLRCSEVSRDLLEAALGPGTRQLHTPSANHKGGSGGGVVQVFKFHPTSRAAMVIRDDAINFIQVDAAKPSLLYSCAVPKFSPSHGSFLHNGHSDPSVGRVLLASGMSPLLYQIDIETLSRTSHRLRKTTSNIGCRTMATMGEHVVVSTKDSRLIVLRNGAGGALEETVNIDLGVQVKDAKFGCADGTSPELFLVTEHSRVLKYDVRHALAPVWSKPIEGALSPRCLAVHPASKYLAVGDSSGMIDFLSDIEAPVFSQRSFKNLQWPVFQMSFDCSGQLLSAFTRHADGVGAAKLFHTASGSALSGFPPASFGQTGKTNAYPWSVDISPHSGYIGMGLSNGRVPLFRINHFPNY